MQVNIARLQGTRSVYLNKSILFLYTISEQPENKTYHFLLWTEYLYLPKILNLKSNPHCDGVWR